MSTVIEKITNKKKCTTISFIKGKKVTTINRTTDHYIYIYKKQILAIVQQMSNSDTSDVSTGHRMGIRMGPEAA